MQYTRSVKDGVNNTICRFVFLFVVVICIGTPSANIAQTPWDQPLNPQPGDHSRRVPTLADVAKRMQAEQEQEDAAKAAQLQGQIAQGHQAQLEATQKAMLPIAAYDISQWENHPAYAGQDFAHLAPEARQHFLDAYAPIADKIPSIVNAYARAVTGNQIVETSTSAQPKPQTRRTASNEPIATGTGFFITSNGFAITNAHVVREGIKFVLVTASGDISARVVRVDNANDLALLKAEGDFNALPVTSSRAVRLGSTVATVGFPNVGMQGFAPKLAKGEIAAMSGVQDDARYFQISVPVQPGNSGGPLVDERGNVVGIVSAKLDAQLAFAASGALPEAVNYAVKSSFILGFLESAQDVSAGLKEPNTKEMKFEDVVTATELSTVVVLVY